MTGRTCLEIAIVRGHINVIEFILQRNPSTALISNSILGRLPLHNAVLSLNFRVTKLLVEIHPDALKHADFEGYKCVFLIDFILYLCRSGWSVLMEMDFITHCRVVIC
jgi:ankyrin repeat protein